MLALRQALALVALLAAAVGSTLLGAAVANAAPVTASGTIVHYGEGYRGSQLARFATTVDPDAGEWVSRVTFSAPQTANNASDLIVSLTPEGQRLPGRNWTAYSDPAVVAGVAAPVPGALSIALDGVALPVQGASIGFEPGNTTLVLRIASPSLIGIDPDTARVSLMRPGTEGAFGAATAFLGAVAPKSTIAPDARRLTLRGRTLRVPLAALASPANRRVALRVGKQWVGVEWLPAKYYRRRVVTVRLDARNAARIARVGRVKLSLRTWIDNGSTTTDTAIVTVRR